MRPGLTMPPCPVTDIPLSKPDLSDLERQAVLDVLRTDRLALGPALLRFESLMARQCGTRHAVAVSSGTAALHLIVRGLGLGEGDEVITTPYSFVASANALLFERARPRFVDIDPETYNLDPARVRDAITPATRAILAVDVFGVPPDWNALGRLAEAHGLLLIDDACEALGASAGGRPIGAWGHAAAFGFYPNKQITTGEGGCITTDSDELAALCRSMRNQGRATDSRMEHVRLGFNYRLNELSAALGCAQLERFDDLARRRAAVAERYRTLLAPLQDDVVLPPPSAPGTARSWFVFVIRLRDHFAPEARDRLLEGLHAQGIGSAPYFPSIHLQPFYRETFGYRPGDFPICEAAAARTVALPFFPGLAPEAAERVVEALRNSLATLPKSARLHG
jgi:perosamine synthetase